MDIRKDRYYCLTPDDTKTLAQLLADGSTRAWTPADISSDDACRGKKQLLIQALLAREILVAAPTAGKPFSEPHVPLVNSSILERSSNDRASPRTLHIWRFFSAAALASRQLKRVSLMNTVAMIKRTKRHRPRLRISAPDVDELVSAFQLLRPYYPRPYLCLFDSLALVHFLFRFGIYPDWVFGVRIAPFGAHCWVQIGGVLLNDILDNVRNYAPIMRV